MGANPIKLKDVMDVPFSYENFLDLILTGEKEKWTSFEGLQENHPSQTDGVLHFSHIVQKGESLAKIVQLETGLSAEESGAFASSLAREANIPVYNLNSWAAKNGVSAESVLTSLRGEGYQGNGSELEFVELQPGQGVSFNAMSVPMLQLLDIEEKGTAPASTTGSWSSSAIFSDIGKLKEKLTNNH